MRQLSVAMSAAIVLALLCQSSLLAQGKTFTDPEKVDSDYKIQGEYSGELGAGGNTLKFGLQVIAMGKGKFEAVGYHGGLPGDGWDGEGPDKITQTGDIKDGTVILENENGKGILKDGVIKVMDPSGAEIGELKRVVRKSKTLGEAAPQGAVVLFDGSSADQWKNGKVGEDKTLLQGTTSKKTFGSHKIHIEFRTPYKPEARGQARGNSGIYVQGRYEVQMLDSFGLKGKRNECGGLYSVKDCDLNMCYPPLQWQTYDIEYTAAEYEDGKLKTNPRITVYHNGVKIHDDVELPGKRNTTAAPVKPGPEKGPVYLQNHGNPVSYRNIWVLEK